MSKNDQTGINHVRVSGSPNLNESTSTEALPSNKSIANKKHNSTLKLMPFEAISGKNTKMSNSSHVTLKSIHEDLISLLDELEHEITCEY